MIGKLLGILFGSMIGAIPGAIIGCFIGHQFDKARRNQRGFQSAFGSGASQAERQTEFFQAAYAVMGHVAKAKGQVTQQEIQLATVMMDRMNLSPEQKKIAQEAFRQGKESGFPLHDTLRKVRFSAGRRRDLLQFFLELQISAAFADGELHPSEIQVLQTVAQELGFTAQYLQQRLRMQEAAFRFQQGGGFGGYQQQGQQSGGQWQQKTSASQLNDAYDLLGVDKDADAKTIKRAHRKLMNEHHPDKLVAKGLPTEMMEVAKQKAQEIQSAYDLIKKEKGFK
ncbi:co-chaperone DjlA [Vibrio hibernica]|uniref:co-chaperone DjlA n=1 Tax=Vibrio hibernica TaxID=2587465 RepID=UPI0018816513|nr:co-chaperone DjlA [Vibrio hibernica]